MDRGGRACDEDELDAEALAGLLQAAVRYRHRAERRSLELVMATAPATVARVDPVDDLGGLAASLNSFSRRADEIVYVDRWAARVRLHG